MLLGAFVVGCGKERLVWRLRGCGIVVHYVVFVCWLLGDVGGVVFYKLTV